MITGIHHAQVSVPGGNAEQVRAFYGGVLGLPEIPRPQGFTRNNVIWFQAGPTQQLHVATEDGVDRSKTRAHVAYHVTDVNHWRTKLTGLGFELFEQPLIPGFDRFHLIDPFGNRIEIIGPEKSSG